MFASCKIPDCRIILFAASMTFIISAMSLGLASLIILLPTEFIEEGIEISIVGEPMAEADGKHAACSTGLQY
jgi:hypothetical protein